MHEDQTRRYKDMITGKIKLLKNHLVKEANCTLDKGGILSNRSMFK